MKLTVFSLRLMSAIGSAAGFAALQVQLSTGTPRPLLSFPLSRTSEPLRTRTVASPPSAVNG